MPRIGYAAPVLAIAILILVVLINGVLALSEIALVSSRRVRLEQAAEGGSRGARAALKLADSPTRLLSTVQVGITLIGIFAGAFGEASLAADLGTWIETLSPRLDGYGREIATVIVVLGITYISLVFGELVPKRLAMTNPERFAAIVAAPMALLAIVTAPVVAFLSFSTDLILRIFGAGTGTTQESVTQEEVSAMITKGTEAGVFEEAEQKIVARVFELGDRLAGELMVPRNEIVWLDADASAERMRVVIATESHSHFPVCRGGLDNLIGVVHVKDMVKSGLISDSVDLVSLARPPVFTPETTPALALLDLFRASNSHLAFVVDEHGALEGLVTLNDLVVQIIGDVARAGQPPEEEMAVRREDGTWLLDGMIGNDSLAELLDEDLKEDGTRTLGGFVMARLGHIPRVGEAFEWRGHRFEVMDMDRHRVDKVLLTLRRDPGPAPEDG